MGLDVYLFKPLKVAGYEKAEELLKESKYFIFDNIEFNNFNILREKYKDFIIIDNAEIYDFEKWFKNNNIDITEYVWTAIDYHDNGYIEYTNINNGNDTIIIPLKEVPTKLVKREVIICKEIGYQRYEVRDEFWEKVARNCWYMTPKKYYDDNIGINFIFTEKEFNNFLKYCEKNASATKWKFEENDMFIYLSY